MLKFFFLFSLFANQNSYDFISLDKIEKEHSKITDEIFDLNQIIEIQNVGIKTFETEIINLDKDINIKNELLNQRLKILFMFLIPEDLYFLNSLKNFEDYDLLSSYAKYLYKKDIIDLENLKLKIYKLNDLRLVLEAEKQSIDEKKLKLNNKLKDLELIYNQKKILIKKIQNDKNNAKAYSKRFLDSEKQISKIIKPKDNIKKLEFESLNKLIKPIKSKTKIIKKFGKNWDSKLRNWVFNNGLLLKVNYSENIYAVKKGTVKFSGWLTGYGKVVVISHDEGLFSVYAHLLKALVNENSVVESGALIAYAGDTGSVNEASLYFELRFYANNIDPSWLFE